MSDIASRLAGLSPEKRALLAQRLREQGSAAVGGAEPIAIIGLGCRFPGGVESPESFWRLISEGGDAVAEVPVERWSADAYYDPDSSRPGRMNTRWGSWLPRLDEFDTAFFGLAPRETARMDPQQRVVLEVCAEALEDAGQTLEQLAGSRTGVYVGTHVNDYAWMAFAGGSPIDAYDSTGTAHSIVANRVSYLFDLRGPSLAVDTACSSSLVAAHLAVQALRQRECDLALACGVNLMLSPLWGLALSKLGMLSPDGRCRTFDARANGIVRGEGCGAVVLKRLSDALADGDPIWALVRGSATNQDGRTNGLTAPNGLAQQAVVRAALANAGVEPQAVGAIEAHGTGTALGDPIEVEALGEVLGAGDPTQNPCVLGSVKTNLGHLEGAAGIAGLIKLVLCLHHESLPRLVHFESPNPLLALSGTRFVLPREARSWKRGARRRLGGVSAFGFGGMNAHVILEEAPVVAPPTDADDVGPHALVVSARTPAALRQRAERLAGWLRGDGLGEPLADVCATAWNRRSRFEHGLAVVGASREELATRLMTAAQGGSPLGAIRVARPGGSRPGLAFVFTGQGTQWPGVTRRLRESEPVVREALERCAAALRPHAGWSLLEELDRPAESSRLAYTEIAQPAVFAIQVALAAWWRSRGVVPEAVVGHSMGEVAAAHVAGVLSLEEAARIIVDRARLMERTRGAGRMLAVELPVDRALEVAHECLVSVAAINSPSSCVLSGEPRAIQEAAAALERSGVAHRFLPVEYAFHSSQMADVAVELGERLGAVERRPAQIRMASTVSGALAREGDFDAAYWARNVREPVRFASAVDALGQVGIRTFVELGPHPALVRPLQQCAALWEDGAGVNALASLHRDLDEPMGLACARGALHLLGHRVDAGKTAPWPSRHVVRLPTYPWQRERFPFARAQGAVSVLRADPEANPLLGSRLPTAIPTFERELTPDSPPWLGDHRLFGKVLFPAAAFVSAAWAAGHEAFGTDDLVVEDLAIRGPLVVPDDSSRRLQVTSTPEGDARRVRVWSASVEEIAKGRWEEHASARVRRGSGTVPEVAAHDSGANEVVLDALAFYARLAGLGAAFGPRFRGILSVRGGRGRAVAEVLLPEERTEGEKPFASPPLLDACLQVAAAALLDQQADAGVLLLPVALERAWCAEARGRRLHVVAVARSLDRVAQEGVVFDLRATDETGSCVMALDGFHLRPSREAQLARQHDLLFAPEWIEAPLAQAGPATTQGGSGVLLIGEGEALVDEVAVALAARGQQARVVHLDRAMPAPGLRPWLEEALRAGGPWRGVVSFLPLAEPAVSRDGGDLPTASVDVLVRGLEVIRAVSSLGAATPPRVLLVTRGARAVARGDESAALASAGLSGLVKVAALEHPEFRVKVADLDPAAHANHVASLAAEILGEADDLEVAYRHGERFVVRIRRPEEAESPRERNERLERSPARVLEELRWANAARRAPGAGEVEIRVRAAGLNFRDVLNALGLYPGPEVPLGNECVGEISALGAGVAGLAVGDRVLAVAFASIADYVTTPASLVVRKPDALSVAAAATLPIAFLTAHYALHELGKMRRGESVLVHAGAGGVGLAAIQLALRAGATVFATAGSDEKRAFLRSLGVSHVMDSRSLGFADELMAVTQGRGVDLVLNSLAGDFIARSLAVTARDGRFLELGKRDVLSAAEMARQRPDVGYHVVYLGEVCDSDPARVGRWLQAIADGVAQGALAPLPFRVFPRTSTVESFRFMAQGRHVGKVVLELSPPNETSRELARPETTHLVTGGLGAIGLDVAEWLAAQGVGALALLGRSGASPAAAERIARLRERGTRVDVFACDVSDRAALAAVLARIDGELPPLAGVWHAAGILDDATLGQLDEGRFARVFAPKVAGAVHLHELTRARPLDAFVLFSSVASLLGWPGQGNYAAANSFLDALAHHRRELGLPGLSVNWGAWSGAGMAATREQSDRDRFARRGLRLMDSERALAALTDAQRLGRAQVGILALDFGAFSGAGGAPGTRLMLSDLAEKARTNGESAAVLAPRDLAGEVAAAPASRRRAIVAARVREQALRTLGLAADFPLDARQGLRDVGLDSLMAVELRNALQQMAGQPLPSTLLFDFPTVEALSAHLLQAVGGDRPQPRAEVALAVSPESALSEEEAEALLREELARSAPPRSGA